MMESWPKKGQERGEWEEGAFHTWGGSDWKGLGE